MSVELTVCGDEVVEGKTHVGYLHRGFEKLMERRTFIQCFPIVCRICVPEPDFNEYCYAAAVEDLAGIQSPERANWIRALVLEMGRINSYLMYLGGQAGALGQGVIGQWTTYARDLMLDRFEEMTGARIYHMFILPGGVRDGLPEGFEQRMEETLREIESTLKDVHDVMFHNAVFKKRTVGLGVIDPAWLDQYGVTGPNARAAGVAKDVRRDQPYLVYRELDFEPVIGHDSDIYTRADVRRRDLLMSVDLIRQILGQDAAQRPADGGHAEHAALEDSARRNLYPRRMFARRIRLLPGHRRQRLPASGQRARPVLHPRHGAAGTHDRQRQHFRRGRA
ncbi:MAG: hypothetical protein V9E86_10485 [Nitrosomonas sp.]